MEELTGILFVVAAIVFKVIEAKLKKAGKSQAPKVETREVFPEVTDQTESGLPKWLEDIQREMNTLAPEPVAPAEVKPVEEAPAPKPATITFEEAMKPMKKAPLRPVNPAPAKVKKPILQEEEEKPREKIDPKKLIVYSEIMNRKY